MGQSEPTKSKQKERRQADDVLEEENGPPCVACGVPFSKSIGLGCLSCLLMEAWWIILLIVGAALDVLTLAFAVASLILGIALTIYNWFGPVRCEACGKWQLKRH